MRAANLEFRNQVVKLSEAGLSGTAIAKKLGCARSTVYYHLTEAKEAKFGPKEKPAPKPEPTPVVVSKTETVPAPQPQPALKAPFRFVQLHRRERDGQVGHTIYINPMQVVYFTHVYSSTEGGTVIVLYGNDKPVYISENVGYVARALAAALAQKE